MTLLGFLWVAAAIAVEAFTGGGGGTILLIGVVPAIAGTIAVFFLKGRWFAGAAGVLVVVVGFLARDVGDAGMVLLPLALAGFIAPVFGAARQARPGSPWTRRFPSQ